MKIQMVVDVRLAYNGRTGAPRMDDILFKIRLESSVLTPPPIGMTICAPYSGDSDEWDNTTQWMPVDSESLLEVADVRLDYVKPGHLGYKVFLRSLVGSSSGDLDCLIEQLQKISIPGSICWKSECSNPALEPYGGFDDKWNLFSMDSDFFRFIQQTLISWTTKRKT